MLLCIDFQPAYAEAFLPVIAPLRCRLRRAARRREEIQFIYNEVYSLEGEELGDPVERLITWGRKERLALKSVRMIRKNFGWVSHLFREGVERKIAISILRQLLASGLQTSAELAGADLERIVAEAYGDFAGFRDCSPDAWEEIKTGAIALPFVFEGGIPSWLHSLVGQQVEVCGGFKHRCLDEMCMILEAGGISYSLNESLIYSLPMLPEPQVETEVPAPVQSTHLQKPLGELLHSPLLLPTLLAA